MTMQLWAYASDTTHETASCTWKRGKSTSCTISEILKVIVGLSSFVVCHFLFSKRHFLGGCFFSFFDKVLFCYFCFFAFFSKSYCGRNVDTCDTNANNDLTRNTFLTLKTYHVIQPSGSRTSLRDQCFFCLVHIFVEFCYSLGFGTTGVSGDS